MRILYQRNEIIANKLEFLEKAGILPRQRGRYLLAGQKMKICYVVSMPNKLLHPEILLTGHFNLYYFRGNTLSSL
jgi:hypothetical protein